MSSLPTYQTIPGDAEVTPGHDIITYSKHGIRRLSAILGVVIAFLSIVGTGILIFSKPRYAQGVVGPLPLLNSQSAEFCKTSCSNPCATHSSMYGPLCCEWSGSENSMQCGLDVSNDVCTCSGTSTSVPVPVKSPASAPTKQQHPKDDDSWDFPPFEPFKPFPPFEPFKPFKPIEVPADAIPCKKSCQRPCGWAQDNGGRPLCCDKADGMCSMTQMNGKCYCSK
jgi:hypothetical protein